ncbi:MAG: hypothetical protein JNL83_15050 [Myxococcales bacterium]|nr:hypothetical protein [Myxococcales bacterium]
MSGIVRVVRIVIVGALLASCASAETESGPATPSKETAVAAGRIRGGGMRMDVQVGRPQLAKPGKAGAIKVTPNTVVAP